MLICHIDAPCQRDITINILRYAIYQFVIFAAMLLSFLPITLPEIAKRYRFFSRAMIRCYAYALPLGRHTANSLSLRH